MLENYGGTPSSEEGLITLVKNYNDIGLYDLAYDSARIEKNYPDYEIVQTVNDVKVF